MKFMNNKYLSGLLVGALTVSVLRGNLPEGGFIKSVEQLHAYNEARDEYFNEGDRDYAILILRYAGIDITEVVMRWEEQTYNRARDEYFNGDRDYAKKILEGISIKVVDAVVTRWDKERN